MFCFSSVFGIISFYPRDHALSLPFLPGSVGRGRRWRSAAEGSVASCEDEVHGMAARMICLVDSGRCSTEMTDDLTGVGSSPADHLAVHSPSDLCELQCSKRGLHIRPVS